MGGARGGGKRYPPGGTAMLIAEACARGRRRAINQERMLARRCDHADPRGVDRQGGIGVGGGGGGEEQRVIVAPGQRVQTAILARRDRAGRALERQRDPACLREPRRVEQQPVRHVHHRGCERGEGAALVEQRARRGEGVVGGEVLRLEGEHRRAERADEMDRVARPRSGARRHRPMRRLADRGQREHALRSRYRVAPQQRHAEPLAQRPDRLGERPVERLVPKRVREQTPHRPRPLGGEVGQVRRDQPMRDIFGREPVRPMHPLRHCILREHERGPADLEHRRIVSQPARGGIRSEARGGR